MSKTRSLELRPRTDRDSLEIGHVQRKSWPGLTVEQFRISPTSYSFALKESPNFIALLNMYRADGETLVDGHPPITTKDLRNKMTFVPSGASLSGWSRLTSAGTCTAIYFDGDSKIEEQAKLNLISPTIAFEDARLRSTIITLCALLKDRAADVAGYAETLATLLIYELNRFSKTPSLYSTIGAGLSQRQAHRVVEYIEGKLHDNITIAELAELLSLSPSHFIRAFKKAVGVPPHQFILRQRVERAKELLSDGDLPVSVIAEEAGFNGLTQLTRAFRLVVGVSPSSFRQDLLDS